MAEDNIAIRLKFLITDLGINSSVFADTCGISKATLSQLLTGRNKKVNDILISQIHKAYPKLSIMWLLFNEGPMWIDSTNIVNPEETPDSKASNPDLNPLDQTINHTHDSISTPAVNSTKNSAENSVSRGVVEDNLNFSKEIGLKGTEIANENIIDQEINNRIKTASLMNEIEILRSKIKKVVQITIYYDDSTFESFFPK